MLDQMYPYNLSQPIKWKPNVEIAPSCPRCDSSNTKFCYYNNYSLTQPRYFCKGCRRYWTKGGSLQNVPVGGGCRKNRRSKSIRLSSSNSSSINNNWRVLSGTGSLRPDLALDGMVGDSSNRSIYGNMDVNSPTIDLAVVYSKFLNPELPVDLVGSSSGSGSDQVELEEVEHNYEFTCPDEYGSGFGDVFSTSCHVSDQWQATEQQQKQQELLCSASEYVTGYHQDIMVNGADWCASMIDQSNFGAFHQ